VTDPADETGSQGGRVQSLQLDGRETRRSVKFSCRHFNELFLGEQSVCQITEPRAISRSSKGPTEPTEGQRT
jgi:hypothetical protein